MTLGLVRAIAGLLICASAVTGPLAARANAWALQPEAQPADPSHPEVLYTLINVTEDLETRSMCPLDYEAVHAVIQAEFNQRNVKAVYSAIANGHSVMTHELASLTASNHPPDQAQNSCLWQTTIWYRGTRRYASDIQFGGRYSSLEYLTEQIQLIAPDDLPPTP
jgi:hypothetical protein